MWYVNECVGNGCTGDFKPGMFGFARVKAIPAGNLVQLQKPINFATQYNKVGIINFPTGANTMLGAAISYDGVPGPIGNWLSMQLVNTAIL